MDGGLHQMLELTLGRLRYLLEMSGVLPAVVDPRFPRGIDYLLRVQIDM